MWNKSVFQSHVLPAFTVLAALTFLIDSAGAVSFTWNTTTSGNWTDATKWDVGIGNPDDASDDATISASGSAYTVTLDANKTIGEFAITSADATLSTGANTLTVDGNASTTTNPGLFNHTAGELNGNFQFIAADVDLSNATSSSATVFDFRQFTGSCCASQANSIDFGTNEEITANQTLEVFAVDSRGIIDLTTTTSVTNQGTIDLTTQGINSGSNQNHIRWDLSGGTLTNQSQLTLASNRATGSARVEIDADLTNDTGATLDASTPTSGQILLTQVGGAHINRADWNVTGTGSGMKIIGGGSSFLQSTVGATLDATSLEFGDDTDASANTFTVSAGSIGGDYRFGRTAVALTGATISGSTSFSFEGEVDNSIDISIPSNVTLNVIGRGISEGTIVDSTASFSNDGTINVESPSNGADFNLGLGRLIVNGGTGTLTNNNALNFESKNTGNFNTFADFDGNLTNAIGGTVTTNVSGAGGGTDQVRFLNAASRTYTNNGTFTVETGTLNMTGGTLNNESTGTLGGNGTLTGIVDNDGTISPGLSAGILTVTGSTQFNAGSQLLIEITGSGAVAGTDYDQLIVSGAVTGLSDADLVVNIAGGLDLSDDVFTILTTSSDLTGLSFDSVTFNGPGDGQFIGTVTFGNGFIELSNIGPVPEPSSAMLLGLACLIPMMRRRRK